MIIYILEHACGNSVLDPDRYEFVDSLILFLFLGLGEKNRSSAREIVLLRDVVEKLVLMDYWVLGGN